MSTNSQTFAAVTGITSDAQRDMLAALNRRYEYALADYSRAVLAGVDALADMHWETARRIAHKASWHGDPALLIDQLERVYA